MKTLALAFALLSPSTVPAFAKAPPQPVLASLSVLERLGAPVTVKDKELDVGYALLDQVWLDKLSHAMHADGKCGGYEVLPSVSLTAGMEALTALSKHTKRDREYALKRAVAIPPYKNPEIVAALAELKEENIQRTVEWLSSFPSRYNRLSDPNQHVVQMQAKLQALLKDYSGKWTVEQIAHTSTTQKSLRVHLEGSSRPSEIVVLGGHLDSISSGGSRAPGADDNASGSSSLFEALRVVALKGPAERSIEFFWYAGEESGLLGSAEIARQYKSASKNVVAVLQLDMTMFPGSGQLVIGNVEDFTSAWLRDYLVAINNTYIGARIIPDRCGYACSDHASWYRQGFPTLMPFESDTDNMNPKIHTDRDVISSTTSFAHSLVFAKIALVLAMDLGNSSQHQPY